MTCAIVELNRCGAQSQQGALAEILFDCVEGGASVSFMWPFTRDEAWRYWDSVIEAVAANRAHLYAALEDGRAVGTVQLWLDTPCNQRHRGDIRKLLVHRRERRRGLASALMTHVEAQARRMGLVLLVLDTATGSQAERLYRRLEWQLTGNIPRYALWPDGRYCDASVYYRELDRLNV